MRHAQPVAALALVAGVFCGPVVGEAAAAIPATLVRTIDTWRWSPPSPDPSGLAYDSASNRLIVTDGEVEEMSIYAGANYYEASLTGTLLRTQTTVGLTREPVGAAFGPGRVFISDDDADRIHQISLGLNGVYDATDSVTSISTTQYAITDPEGLSYDVAGNRLFVAGGEASRLFEISPVDGVFGNGDDTVRQIDTVPLGVSDPEAVEFRPETGTLFTIGTSGNSVLELTPSGSIVTEIDVSGIGLDAPAGLAWAPRSTDSSQRSLYIADRKADNNSVPSENDGAIYEVAFTTATTPSAVDVRVRAGADDAEQAPSGSVALTGSDLELVDDGAARQTVGLRFSALGIPRGARITSAHIQFNADESQSVSTALAIAAQAADTAPAFTTATNNVSSRPRTAARVSWAPAAWSAGAAGAAQRTPDLSAVVQEVVNRGGWASGNAIAFIVTGAGHRTAESFEGAASRAPLLHVEFAQSAPNQPPTVNAGPDQAITLPAGAALDGTVTDDGAPNPTPTVGWSRVSGPGTVTFANPASVDTQATFSAAGTYVLRLTANDGAATASDDMSVVVSPATTRGAVDVRVAAGADDAEQGPTGTMYVGSSDLELTFDDPEQQTVGLRFAGLAVPRGATVTNAWIQFVADESQSVATSLTVAGQAADNALSFSSATSSITSRARTAATVTWAPPAWTTGAAGAAQRTPNLASVLQEVVSRPGWASGNAVAIIISGSGHRTAEAFEGGAAVAPLLHVDYQ